MQTVPLSALARSTDTSLTVLRHGEKVPCVLYGNKVENTTLQCEYMELYKAYVKAGESTIVELDIDGKKVPVLFHEVQMDPFSDKIIHVDFYAVDMTKEIEAYVPIHFVDEAPAVKDLGGILVAVHDHVTVKCLPSNLPHSISLSIASLAEFDASLLVSDLTLPAGVQVMDDADLMLVTVQEPRKEEVAVPVATEGAEGAAATPEAGAEAAPATEESAS